MNTVQFTVTFEVLTCGECGIEFAVPTSWVSVRREDHRSWCCPNKHDRHFPAKNAIEIANEEKLAIQARLNNETHARLVAEKKQREAEVKVNQLIARASRGICPCCNRTFSHSRMAAHMKSKHPNEIPGSKRKEIAA